MTSLLTLLALYIFDGATIQNFVLAILIGVALGTYSSIFNASLLLYSWEVGELKRLPALLLHGSTGAGDRVVTGLALERAPAAGPACAARWERSA